MASSEFKFDKGRRWSTRRWDPKGHQLGAGTGFVSLVVAQVAMVGARPSSWAGWMFHSCSNCLESRLIAAVDFIVAQRAGRRRRATLNFTIPHVHDFIAGGGGWPPPSPVSQHDD